jgi:hypothetical protein
VPDWRLLAHSNYYIFNEKKSDWEYCKEFWGITEKMNFQRMVVFGMITGMNAYSCWIRAREITDLEEKQTLKIKYMGVA